MKIEMAKKETSPRQRAWQAMRILPRWTLGDLESTAEISRSNLDKYIAALLKAGYIRCIQPRKAGVKGGYAAYSLIKNTGPRCPKIVNYYAVVRDMNAGEEVTIGKPKRAKKQRNNKPNRHTITYQENQHREKEVEHVG